jgi:hypothetical protein
MLPDSIPGESSASTSSLSKIYSLFSPIPITVASGTAHKTPLYLYNPVQSVMGPESKIAHIQTVRQPVIFEKHPNESLLSYDSPQLIYATQWNTFPVIIIHELPEKGLVTTLTTKA